jgi:hypothetical protein
MKSLRVALLATLLIFSSIGLAVAIDNPNIEISIQGGLMFYSVAVYNNYTYNVTANYSVIRIFSNKPIEVGNFTVPPKFGIGPARRVISLVPFVIRISCDCKGEGKYRDGIIFGPFVILGKYHDL